MARCECCGAQLKEGDQFCGECGTIVANRTGSPDRAAQWNDEKTVSAVSQPIVRNSAPVDSYEETTVAAQPNRNQNPPPAQPNRNQNPPPAQPNWNQNPPPAQPNWNQNPPPAQPNWNQNPPPAQPAWAQYVNQPRQAFVVPQRPLSKGGGITMIIFGSFLIFSFLCGLIAIITTGAGEGASASVSSLIMPIVSMVLFVLGGGLLLLLFGIRKVKNVNRYNKSIGH